MNGMRAMEHRCIIMVNDYDQAEIDHMVDSLLDVHQGKLMRWEIEALNEFKAREGFDLPLNHNERDWLVGIYDRIGEETY